ncbi:MAG TPA: hypothetical protein VK614_07190 [Allosphingosinicella sp.]|nr:hypothetical protein [Allosphingosinicella sp.]
MRLFGLLLLTACLAGCGGRADSGPAARHGGRYVGIGIYSPGAMWQRLAGVEQSRDAAGATLDDDEQVIVVVDSQTGEVRQCGNLSGHCIRMNPWSGQPAPARLTGHRAELEQADVVNQAAPVETKAAGRR